MRAFVLLISTACAAEVPVENCAEDFRDTWWYIDPDVTDAHNLQPTCFRVGSDGYMETIHYDSDVHMENKWTCVGDDDIRINGKGRAQFFPTDYDDEWVVDLNLTVPPLKETAIVSDCFWR